MNIPHHARKLCPHRRLTHPHAGELCHEPTYKNDVDGYCFAHAARRDNPPSPTPAGFEASSLGGRTAAAWRNQRKANP